MATHCCKEAQETSLGGDANVGVEDGSGFCEAPERGEREGGEVSTGEGSEDEKDDFHREVGSKRGGLEVRRGCIDVSAFGREGGESERGSEEGRAHGKTTDRLDC